MSIQTEADYQGLLEAGRITRLLLTTLQKQVRPGITTAELDRSASALLAREGARSAPKLVYGFPGDVCISINEEAVHGIPGGRELCDGDLVKLDVTVEKNGYMADAAVTVPVGTVSDRRMRLMTCARHAFYRGLRAARPGAKVNQIGRAVEQHVRGERFSVIRELSGHGIGRSIHEEPNVPNYYEPRQLDRLSEGLVITIEPIIAEHRPEVIEKEDGWTISTVDGGASAHYEHTIVIARGKPILLTA
jgi:methionyl aminopeptidase